MNSTAKKRLAWIGAALLLALHLDFWRERSTDLLFDWLPTELAYRIGWMLLAFGYLSWFCSAIWQEDE
jgi:hypothetical protein